MKGFKGIEVVNGILRSKSNGDEAGAIFEIGVLTDKTAIDDGMGFSEKGYSFCGAIEDVLPWENFLGSKYAPGFVVSRLFRIDTLNNRVIGSKSHYKAERIVVLEEVCKEEIIKYFEENPKRLPEEYKRDFESFCEMQWEPYTEVADQKSIGDLIVYNCFRRHQKSLCLQEAGFEDIEKCKICPGYMWRGDVGNSMFDYLYLQARRKIKAGMPLSDVEEYHQLKSGKRSIEAHSLELLSNRG